MKTLTVVLVILLFAVLWLHDVRGAYEGAYECLENSGSKLSKTTPIKPVRFCTPVIKSQTIRGSRTKPAKLFTRVASGYLVMRYALNKAPVYREGFPVYKNYVSIPEERAVRISSERVSLLNSDGNLCLSENSSVPRSFKDGIEKNLVELKATVIYKTNPEKVTILYGVNDTVSLDDIKDKTFTVTIRTRYNVTVVRDTDCTQLEKQVNGTMIDLYEFNPNAENKARLLPWGLIALAVGGGIPFFVLIFSCFLACYLE